MAGKSKDDGWLELHETVFKAQNVPWNGGVNALDNSTLAAYPGIRELTNRELDCLRLLRVQFPEKNRRMINVQPSIDRVTAAQDHFGCTTPAQRVWLTDRCRLMLGYEGLLSQGIYDEDRDPVVRNVPNRLLQDLAGNAFHTGCCLVTTQATFLALALSPKKTDSGDAALVIESESDDGLADVWGN